MTPEEIKTLGHAFFDGKTLQYSGAKDIWKDWTNPYCPDLRDGLKWRIKPDEPKKVKLEAWLDENGLLMHKANFGEGYVARPSASDIEKNILSGQSALVRAKDTLAKPGVKIIRSEGKPIYFASPDQPDVFIREMNGVRTYGKLSAGRFLPLPIQTPNPQQKKRTT